MKFDNILMDIGELGPYQIMIFGIMSLSTLICGAQSMSFIFAYEIPSHRCRIPDYPHDTYAIQNQQHSQAINFSIPPGDVESEELYSKCRIYSSFNATSFLADTDGWSGPMTYRNRTEACHEWVYDKSEVEVSVITEFDIVCDRMVLRSHIFTANFVGALVGSLVIGVGADLFGRKKALLLSLAAQFVTAVSAYLAPSFQFLIAVKAFTGLASHSVYITTITTGIELVGPSKRASAGVLFGVWFIVGALALTPLVYFVRYWRTVQLTLGLINVPIIVLTIWLVPESPRWLLEKKRYHQAEKVLKKICESNKTQLPAEALSTDSIDEGPQLRIWKIFGHRVLVIRSVIVFFCWVTVSMALYGFTIELNRLGGSLFINHVIGVVVDFAGLVTLLLYRCFGRRTLFSAFLFVAGLSSLGSALATIFQSPDWLLITLNMLGRFTAGLTYIVMYLLSTELFPTVLRYSGMGMCSVFENVGGIVTSYVIDLSFHVGRPVGPAIHFLVYTGVCLVTGVLSFVLPETKNHTLPESLQDAIDFGRKGRHPKRIQSE